MFLEAAGSLQVVFGFVLAGRALKPDHIVLVELGRGDVGQDRQCLDRAPAVRAGETQVAAAVSEMHHRGSIAGEQSKAGEQSRFSTREWKGPLRLSRGGSVPNPRKPAAETG